MGKKFKIADVDSDDRLFAKIDGLLGDPYEDLLGDDFDKKKKKKKKKDKGKGDTGSSFKESLKELSKKELRAKCDEMGIDLDYIDRESKKSMRAAILKARKDARATEKIKDEKPKKKDLKPVLSTVVPPFYFDEDSRKFVICNAADAPDIEVFNAMRGLGALRRQKRADDGFAELMERISAKIQSGELDEPDPPMAIPDAIDVEYREVTDEPKPEEKPTEPSKADIEKFSKEIEQFSQDVSKAIDDLKKTNTKKKK